MGPNVAINLQLALLHPAVSVVPLGSILGPVAADVLVKVIARIDVTVHGLLEAGGRPEALIAEADLAVGG